MTRTAGENAARHAGLYRRAVIGRILARLAGTEQLAPWLEDYQSMAGPTGTATSTSWRQAPPAACR